MTSPTNARGTTPAVCFMLLVFFCEKMIKNDQINIKSIQLYQEEPLVYEIRHASCYIFPRKQVSPNYAFTDDVKNHISDG